MSTSQQQRQTPRPMMSLTEVIIGAVFVLALFAIGPIGYHTHEWSDKTAALLAAGGVLGGFTVWAVVHAALVGLKMIRPIDVSLQYQRSGKPNGRR